MSDSTYSIIAPLDQSDKLIAAYRRVQDQIKVTANEAVKVEADSNRRRDQLRSQDEASARAHFKAISEMAADAANSVRDYANAGLKLLAAQDGLRNLGLDSADMLRAFTGIAAVVSTLKGVNLAQATASFNTLYGSISDVGKALAMLPLASRAGPSPVLTSSQIGSSFEFLQKAGLLQANGLSSKGSPYLTAADKSRVENYLEVVAGLTRTTQGRSTGESLRSLITAGVDTTSMSPMTLAHWGIAMEKVDGSNDTLARTVGGISSGRVPINPAALSAPRLGQNSVAHLRTPDPLALADALGSALTARAIDSHDTKGMTGALKKLYSGIGDDGARVLARLVEMRDEVRLVSQELENSLSVSERYADSLEDLSARIRDLKAAKELVRESAGKGLAESFTKSKEAAGPLKAELASLSSKIIELGEAAEAAPQTTSPWVTLAKSAIEDLSEKASDAVAEKAVGAVKNKLVGAVAEAGEDAAAGGEVAGPWGAAAGFIGGLLAKGISAYVDHVIEESAKKAEAEAKILHDMTTGGAAGLESYDDTMLQLADLKKLPANLRKKAAERITANYFTQQGRSEAIQRGFETTGEGASRVSQLLDMASGNFKDKNDKIAKDVEETAKKMFPGATAPSEQLKKLAAQQMLGDELKQPGIKDLREYQTFRETAIEQMQKGGKNLVESIPVLDKALGLASPDLYDYRMRQIEIGKKEGKKYGVVDTNTNSPRAAPLPSQQALANAQGRPSDSLKLTARELEALGKSAEGADDFISRLKRSFDALFGGKQSGNPQFRPGRSFGENGVQLNEYATGGLALRPQIARIAERGPEAVIPLNKLGALVPNRGGITVNVHSSPSLHVSAQSGTQASQVGSLLDNHREELVREIIRGIDRRFRDRDLMR